jgi:hypothetical protein
MEQALELIRERSEILQLEANVSNSVHNNCHYLSTVSIERNNRRQTKRETSPQRRNPLENHPETI